MNVKICAGPKVGGTARGGVRYILGYSLGSGEHDDSLTPEERRALFHDLIQESLTREDLGVGVIWSPTTGRGSRPSSIYAEGVTSLATSDLEMDVSSAAAKAHLIKDKVLHVVLSFDEDESKWLSDEQVVKATLALLRHDEVGLAEHRKVVAVHRDTLRYDREGNLYDGNVHAHVMVEAIHPDTLRPWIRQRDWFRMSYSARDVEIHAKEVIGAALKHDHGLYVVREHAGEKRIELATAAELEAWSRERLEERLQEEARRYVGDYREYETVESWAAAEVEAPIREYLEEAQARGEQLRWSDVHLIVARAGGRLERDTETRGLRVRWMERAAERVALDERERKALVELAREHRYWRDSYGHNPEWLPAKQYDLLRNEMASRGDHVRERPPRQEESTLPVIALDRESLTGKRPSEESEQGVWGHRVAWLAEYQDPTLAEREFVGQVLRSPGVVSREIVAGGKALFSRDDIDEFLGARISDPESLSHLSQHVEERDSSLVMLSADVQWPLFTTRAQQKLEENVAAKARSLAREKDPRFDRGALTRAISEVEMAQGIQLSDEQRGVLDGLEYRLSWVQGDAGTGKTTIMAVANRYCELVDRPIVGLTTAQRAAEELERRSGAFALNSTRAIVYEKHVKRIVKHRAVTMLDEASMLDMKHLNRVLDLARERDAVVIGIGDAAQIPSTAAGDAHRVMCEVTKECGHYSELHDVRRQQGDLEWMRPVVQDLGRAIREGDEEGIRQDVRVMAGRGIFEFREDRSEVFKAAAADYAECVRRCERVVVNCHGRRDVRHLNKEIRARLGFMTGTPFKTVHGNVEVAAGERIVFTKNDRQLKVLNGYGATVTAVNYDGKRRAWRITATLDDGKVVTWDPNRYRSWSHGYAVTTHKAQGQSAYANIYVMPTQVDARLANAGWTRGENVLKVYVSRQAYATPADIADGLAQRAETKPDVILYREVERRYGGPNSYWARNVRRAMEDDRHPLKQQWREEMCSLKEDRQIKLRAINERYQKLMTIPGLSTENKKLLERKHRRDVQLVMQKTKPQTFFQWAADPRRAARIARQGQQLELVEKIRRGRCEERSLRLELPGRQLTPRQEQEHERRERPTHRH